MGFLTFITAEAVMEKSDKKTSEIEIKIMNEDLDKAYAIYNWSGADISVYIEISDGDNNRKYKIDHKVLESMIGHTEKSNKNVKHGKKISRYLDTIAILFLSLAAFYMQIISTLGDNRENIPLLFLIIKWSCFIIAFFLLLRKRIYISQRKEEVK